MSLQAKTIHCQYKPIDYQVEGYNSQKIQERIFNLIEK